MAQPPSHDARDASADAWLEPAAIAISDGQRSVTVTWGDGHTSVFLWWYLRGMCPCAVCQGHGGDHAFVPEGADSDLDEVHEVGHYALNFTWRDGHRTGIYSFRTLRLLCPCTGCRAAIGSQHACMLPAVAERLDAQGG